MDQHRLFSDNVYDVESKGIQTGDTIGKNEEYLVIDTIDTNKQTIGNEALPKGNSMQAMVVAEIKDDYKNDKKIKNVPGYPDSVVKKDVTIAYAGTSSWQDWKTNGREIAVNDKHENGAFQSAVSYADVIAQRFPDTKGYTVSTTGHSLGGAEAIYVSVLKGFNGFTYGAAGSGLTDEQLQKYKGHIVNLFDTSDIVTSGLLTGGKTKIPFLSLGIDNGGVGNIWAFLGTI